MGETVAARTLAGSMEIMIMIASSAATILLII